MKKLTIILLPFAVCSLLLVGAQVAGAASHVNSTKTVRVVMRLRAATGSRSAAS